MAGTNDEGHSVQIEVLGPIRMRVGDREVKVGGSRQQRVLAALLVDRGRIVPAEVLAERVWGDDEWPEDPNSALRTYVSRLRSEMNRAGADGEDVLRTDRPGYRLELSHDSVDDESFVSLVTQGRTAARTGELDRAVTLLGRALETWRGRPYGDLAELDWLQPEEVRLGELHLTAREEHAAARLSFGVDADLLASLERLVALDPLRPRPTELLMRALHTADRQRDALHVASRHREALADVGLEPSPTLRDLEARIAVGDPMLDTAGNGLPSVRGYVVRDRVRQGPEAVTYRAGQESLDRDVSLTRVRAAIADDAGFIRRFEAECTAVSRLEHPSIAPLEDAWREPGAAWLVTPWYPDTLVRRLERRNEEPIDLMALITQVGGAVSAAHAAGIAHGRVRPSNVWFDAAGNAHLGDFPVGRGIGSDAARTAADVAGVAGLVAEAATGRKVDVSGATDLGAGLSLELAASLRRALDPDPSRRHERIDDLMSELLAAIRHDPPTLEDPWDPPGTVAPVPNPYKGLRAFQESDAEDFHGRDELVAELLDRLERPGDEGRLLLLVGPSGSGKSSLVRAGLVPAIRSRTDGVLGGAFVSSMIPGRSPFDELAAALARVSIHSTTGLTERLRRPGGLASSLAELLPDPHSDLVLVVDQLEELYTTSGDDQPAFVEALVDAISAPHARLRVVATIRADLWDKPLQDDVLAPFVRDAAVAITPLVAAEIEAAVIEPARRVGVAVEPALAAAVANEVTRGPGALPLLQYALTELFDHSSASGTLTRKAFADLGGVAGAVSRRADELLAASTVDERVAARALFGRLVTLGEGIPDTRRRARLAELPDDFATQTVLHRFASARLLSYDRDPTTRAPTVEVAHEALIAAWPRLRTWLEEDRSMLRQQRQLTEAADAWAARGEEPADLHRGSRLAADEELLDAGISLNHREVEFVRHSMAHREAERERERRRVRRLRSLLAVTAIAAVVALVGGVLAARSARDADRARAIADVERLRAVAGREADARPDLAALLAVEAQRLDPGAASLSTLHEVLIGAPSGLLATLPHPDGGIYAPRLLADEGTVVAASSDGFHVWDPAARTLQRRIERPGADIATTATAGRLLAAASGEGMTLHDLDDGELITNSMLGRQWRLTVGTVDVLAGAPDGSRLAEVRLEDPTTIVMTDLDLLVPALRADERPPLSTISTIDVGQRVTALAWGATTGDLLVGAEGWLRSIDTETGTIRWQVDAPLRRDRDAIEDSIGSPPPVTSLAVTRDGRRAATAWGRDLDSPESRLQASTVVELIDVDSGTVEAGAELTGRASELVWLDEGDRRVGSLEDGRLARAYDLDGGMAETLIPDRPMDVGLTLISEELLATAGGRTIQIWSRTGAGPLRTTLPVLDSQRTSLTTFGGEIVVAAVGDNAVAVSHRPAAGAIGRAIGPTAMLHELSTGERRLAGTVWTSNGSITLVSGNSGTGFANDDGERYGRRARSVGDDGSHMGRVAASPDGRFFAIARPDGVVELHDDDGEILGPLRNGSLDPDEATEHVSFSADGELVAAHQLGGAGRWTIWRSADRDRVAGGTAEDLARPVLAGDLLLASRADGAVLRLDPRNLEPVAPPLIGHACCLLDADLDPEGDLLATLGLDVRVWDLATGEQLGAAVPVDRTGNVRWLGAGRRLAVPGADVVTVWDFDIRRWRAAACAFAGRDISEQEWVAVGPRTVPRRATC